MEVFTQELAKINNSTADLNDSALKPTGGNFFRI